MNAPIIRAQSTVTTGTFRATISVDPEAVTEIHNSQKGTPCCAMFGDGARAGGSAKTLVVCDSEESQALAYGQFTRLSVAGQRTGGGNHAPGRVGERS